MSFPPDPADVVRRPPPNETPPPPLPIRLVRWFRSWQWPFCVLVAVLLIVFVAAGLSPATEGSPKIQVELAIRGDVPLTLSSASFNLPKLAKDVPVARTLQLTNDSHSDASVTIVPLTEAPPGVHVTYDIGDRLTIPGSSASLAAGTTVPITITFVSSNLDSGSFTYHVLFSTSVVSTPPS